MLLRKEIDELAILLTKTKQKFESTIQDQTLSLDRRWEVFSAAPDYLKNQDIYIPTFSETMLSEVSWYDDFYCERYSTVKMVDIVRNLEEDFEEKNSERYFRLNPTKEKIVELKEMILSRNLGSFVVDW